MRTLIFFLASFFFIASAQPALAEDSLFDEKKKDAASSLKVEIENDRPVRTDENRRYVQPSRNYTAEKVLSLEDQFGKLSKRMDSLEREFAELKNKRGK